MSKPYDASTKFLVAQYLVDWLALCQIPTKGRAKVIEADLSTVTAEADKVLLVEDPEPWIFHLELQASRDDRLEQRLHWYNALLEYRHDLPVYSLVVLLRKQADSGLTGELHRQVPGRKPYRWFHYQVSRTWQLSVESLLNGGLGLLPLAPLCDEAVNSLPQVIQRMMDRIQKEVPDKEMAGTLWTTTDVLMGLRYERSFVDKVIQGVFAMKESVTYQAIVEEGGVLALRVTLLSMGRKKFGPPDLSILATVNSITDIERLKELCDRLLDVKNWTELLE